MECHITSSFRSQGSSYYANSRAAKILLERVLKLSRESWKQLRAQQQGKVIIYYNMKDCMAVDLNGTNAIYLE